MMQAEENFFCRTNNLIGTRSESSQFCLKSSCHTAQGRTQQSIFILKRGDGIGMNAINSKMYWMYSMHHFIISPITVKYRDAL